MATPTLENLLGLYQSQKTEGFSIADFATLFDERGSRSKFFLLFNMDTRTLISKICSHVRKFLRFFSQTNMMAAMLEGN